MAEQLHDWQKEFALKENLTQGDFEALEMALAKLLAFHRAFREMSSGAGAYLPEAEVSGLSGAVGRVFVRVYRDARRVLFADA